MKIIFKRKIVIIIPNNDEEMLQLNENEAFILS